MTIIDKIIVKYLIAGKYFFASLLTQMKKVETESIPTMAVTCNPEGIVLLYNVDFIEEVTRREGAYALKGILEHEVLHIVMDHLGRAKRFKRHMRLYNVAADMSINQLIDADILPKKGKVTCKPCKGKGVVKKEPCKACGGSGVEGIALIYPEDYQLPRGKDAEFYYEELYKKAPKMKCPTCGGKGKVPKGDDGEGKGDGEKGEEETCPTCGGSGDGLPNTVDSHEEWEKIKESEQMVKETVKKAVAEAYDTHVKGRGKLPGALEEKIKELLKPPTIAWQQLLRQYIGASIKTGFKSSWKRPNRRFGGREDIKGKTSDRVIRMLLAIDTSGSVSDKDFVDFMGEMKGILNIYRCSMDLIQCDTQITSKEQVKPYTKFNIKFKGRGGTEFKPVFDYLRIHPEYDLLIYFTDMQCSFEGCQTTKSVIWVCTEQGSADAKPPVGKVVQIKQEKK